MRRTPLTVAGASFALALTLAACGGDDSTDDATPTTSAGGAGGGSEVVVVGKNNLSFDKDAYEAKAGTVDFVYENEGSIAHTLLVRGKSGFKLSIGNKDEGSIDLEPGTYELYCDVAGHEAAGMVADLTVA
ncbi:MAG: hypothetical protein M3Z03_14700 [Actinomycetota bacterium]|nr:hypothetical protein [Actinomycetota bacterium]